jgi:hypothetical protein
MTTLVTDSAPRLVIATSVHSPAQIASPIRGILQAQRNTTVFLGEVTGVDPAGAPAVDPLAESIIYVCALIADRPRAIDRYFDYFGERRPVVRKAPANTPSSPVASGPAVSNP